MTDWIRTLLDCRSRGQPAMLVTVASVRGSAPREAGARMVVTGDAQYGTIGGGHLELQAVGIARDLLASTAASAAGALRRFSLGASLGQCCGGAVELMFEPVSAAAEDAAWLDAVAAHAARGTDCVVVSVAGRPASSGVLVASADAVAGSLGEADCDADAVALARTLLASGQGGTRLLRPPSARGTWLVDPIRPAAFTVVLFGAGHVGQALVRVLGDCPCRVVWVDPRPEAFPATVPPAVRIEVSDDPVERVDAAPPGSYFLVMTHSHPLDEALALRILQRRDVAWFGLIGSATKRRRFEQRLGGQGIDPRRLSSMACPIGVADLPGKEPGVVAISVAAQLLQVRAGHLAAAAGRTPAATGDAAGVDADVVAGGRAPRRRMS